MTLTLTPWSSSSHGATGQSFLRGRIESIVDPEGRNRVQVRIFGYQDDTGTIPKEDLEWVHVMTHNSQIPGATSTQPYYPGAEVLIIDSGTEKFIVGAIPGFDGEKRLTKNPDDVDSSENQNSDVPNINRQSDKDTTVRTDNSIVGPPGDRAGANNYFNYDNWKNNITKMYPYSTGKGEKPAPWGKGDVSKQDQLQSIGLQKNIQGSDILNLIMGLDDNESGAIKEAIHLILNLRNNGFGNAMNMLGSGVFNNVLNQYATQFGSTTQNDLINILQHLILHIKEVQKLNNENFYNNVTSGLLNDIVSLLSNKVFNVSSDVLGAIQGINDVIILSNGNGNINFYAGLLVQFVLLFNTAVSQAFTSILNQLNVLIQTVNNNIGTFITMFGGRIPLVQFAQSLLFVAAYLGIPQIALNTVANGVIGLALGGDLTQIATTIQNQPTTPSNSNQSISPNLLIGLLAIFRGNGIGTQELMSGNLITDFLSGNPKKYKQEDRNHGQQVLKRFPD